MALATIDFTFSSLITEDEYLEVLALRLKSYKSAKKIPPTTTRAQMGDEFDSRSKIIIAKHDDKIVGSVRVIFHQPEDELSYGRYFAVPPPGLPSRQEYAEASRMCIDPNYQGMGLFYKLAEEMVNIAINGGRTFIVGGSTGKLTDVWLKCGFRKLGIQYISQDIGGIPHELILLDTRLVMNRNI